MIVNFAKDSDNPIPKSSFKHPEAIDNSKNIVNVVFNALDFIEHQQHAGSVSSTFTKSRADDKVTKSYCKEKIASRGIILTT